jgi:hypothetical protein
VPDGEFERRLSVSSSKSSALKAVGDGVVSFAMDTHVAGVLRLGMVSRIRLRSGEMLATGGQLDRTRGGEHRSDPPSVNCHQHSGRDRRGDRRLRQHSGDSLHARLAGEGSATQQ